VPPTANSVSYRYHILTESDRNVLKVLSDWLAPIPWQFFLTLEFPWNVARHTATVRFHDYLNSAEKRLGDSICFIAGVEGKSKFGELVPWHIHLLMTSSRPIPANLLKELWWAREGRGTRSEIHPEGDSIIVLPFDAEKRGLEYCLKFANDCRGDWMWNWLEIFNPNIPSSAHHRVARRRRRSGITRP
jgi:hypothetical protein